MNFNFILIPVGIFFSKFKLYNADGFDEIDLSERMDQETPPNNCVTNANDPQLCIRLMEEKSRPVINPNDCFYPYKYNSNENVCYLDKNTDYFYSYVNFNDCMFGRLMSGVCAPFDLHNHCVWKQGKLDAFKNANCPEKLGDICVYDLKAKGVDGKQVINAQGYLKLEKQVVLNTGTKIELYYRTTFIDIEKVEVEWQNLQTKFNLAYDFFSQNQEGYETKYNFQVEKFCMLNAIEDYYYYHSNFKEKTNSLRFGVQQVNATYALIKKNYRETTLNTLRLLFESNKSAPNESPFKILLNDPEDIGSTNHDFCFKQEKKKRY